MRQPQKPTAAEEQILALGHILQKLREEENIDVIIDTTVSYLQEQFDYSLIWIALYNRLNHTLSGKGGVIPGHDTSYLTQRFFLNPGDLLEQVVIEQRPLGVADLRTELRAEKWQSIANKFQIQGTIVLPMSHRNRCLGLVLLGSQRWGYILGGDARARLMMVLGELGAVLYQIEVDLQHKQTKHIEEPLLRLLENFQTLNHLESRLEAVIEATHQFVTPTRTNIYWFEREKRYFWLRASNQLVNVTQPRTERQSPPGITVQELSDFYYALSVNEIVVIGEGRSSLKSNFTGKLLKRLQLRSLLAAPIIWQKDLLGFLAVEAKEARIWTEADKNFVKGAAGFLSLALPLDNMETVTQRIQEDAQLTGQIARGIYKEREVVEILRDCAAKVLRRLGATRFWILQYDPEQNKYQFFYQSQLQNRRPLICTLNALKDLDWQLLQRSTTAVGIENIEEDLRFFNWRTPLQESGVRAFLVSNCAQEHPPEALLVIATETRRHWTTLEAELLQVVSQQLGVIVRQWQLHHQTEQQQKILHSFQQCLRILEQAQSSMPQAVTHLEQEALKQIATVLSCPLTLLLSWKPGQYVAEIIPGVIANDGFTVAVDAPISYQSECLIQWSLATDSFLTLKVEDLLPETRKWLKGSNIGQILVMALRTNPDYQPTAVVVIADCAERRWSEQSLSAMETLVCQLAWSRRQLQITQILQHTTEKLQQLNWYKHRRLEEIQRTVTLLLGQLHDLGIPTNELAHTRYQQLLRQLDNTTASMTAMLKLEQWQLHLIGETIPVTSLLKRALERVDNLLKQRKLWVGVHGLGQETPTQELEKNSAFGLKSGILLSGEKKVAYYSSLAITGDTIKIELILYELLIAACHRSAGGQRIDIWCRRIDEHLLEISITDNGTMEPQLLADLEQNTSKDLLIPSTLNQPPGLHLHICQNLIHQLHGELHFYQLPDSRVVSRLILPLAHSV